jgi:hypothetical protein
MRKHTISKLTCPSLISLLTFFLAWQVFAQPPTWHTKLRQLEPTISSGNDVERIFLEYKLEKSFIDKGIEARYYQSPEGRLSVYLAATECAVGSNQLSRGSVINATFFPIVKDSLSKFKLSKRAFSETMENDNPTIHLINSSAGLDYSTQRGRVINVTIFPPGFSGDYFKCS